MMIESFRISDELREGFFSFAEYEIYFSLCSDSKLYFVSTEVIILLYFMFISLFICYYSFNIFIEIDIEIMN